MNTHGEFARIVSDWLETRTADPPPGSLRSALARVDATPQQHHRWLPWWFGRGGSVTGSAAAHGRETPTNDRRYRIMISATVAATTVAIIALVAMLAIPSGTGELTPAAVETAAPTPASSGMTFTVAPTTGGLPTISEAVAAAQDGDTVLVAPGTYDEALVIDKAISLRGAGDHPGRVVIAAPRQAPVTEAPVGDLGGGIHGPETPTAPAVGIQLLDADATIANVQLVAPDGGIALLVRGGAPRLDRVVIKPGGFPVPGEDFAGGLFVLDGADMTATGVTVWHQLRVDGGSSLHFHDGQLQYPLVAIQGRSQLELSDSLVHGDCDCPALTVVGGSSAQVRGNTFQYAGISIIGAIDAALESTITDNSFDAATGSAVYVTDAAASIGGNTFSRNDRGVTVTHTDAEVYDNRFTDNATAIVLSGTNAAVHGNAIEGGDTGIAVVFSGAPSVSHNSVDGAVSRGIIVGSGTKPAIDGNRVCGSEINLYIEPAAKPQLGTNGICADGVAIGE